MEGKSKNVPEKAKTKQLTSQVKREFLLWHSRLMIQLVSAEVLAWSVACLSGLRIQHCYSCSVGHSSGSDSTTGPVISICQLYTASQCARGNVVSAKLYCKNLPENPRSCDGHNWGIYGDVYRAASEITEASNFSFWAVFDQWVQKLGKWPRNWHLPRPYTSISLSHGPTKLSIMASSLCLPILIQNLFQKTLCRTWIRKQF